MTNTNAVLVIDDIAADLIGINELNDGEREYREADGVLYVDCYDENSQLDANGLPIPTQTYRIDITASLA